LRKYVYVLGGIVALALALWAFALVSTPPVEKVRLNPLICPECHSQLPRENALCLVCEAKRRKEEQDEARGVKRKGLSPASKLTLAIVTVGSVVIVLGWRVLCELAGLRQARKPAGGRGLLARLRYNADQTFVVRCEGCHRKRRYPASKIGGTGVCPNCHRQFEYVANRNDVED
jgi:hypothetical protein